jgi:hypothetical protein
MMGFSKTLKGLDAAASGLIEVKIKRLSKPADVDADIYPVKLNWRLADYFSELVEGSA